MCESILFKTACIPRGLDQIMSRQILWITRYFWFMVSAHLLFHHFLLINTWHGTLAEKLCEIIWNTSCFKGALMFLCVFVDRLGSRVLLLTQGWFLNVCFVQLLSESCFHCRILLWAFLSSCEAQSRRNWTGLSTCMISIKMDISLKRCVCEAVSAANNAHSDSANMLFKWNHVWHVNPPSFIVWHVRMEWVFFFFFFL